MRVILRAEGTNRQLERMTTPCVELATAIVDYIMNFYNPMRRHSSLDYLTPEEFEALPLPDNTASALVTVGQ